MSKTALLEAFEEYITIVKVLDDDTIEAYIRDLTQLEAYLDKPLTKLNTTDILSFLSQFENKRTLNRKLSSINAFFAFCHKQRFTHEKISIPMAKIPKDLPKYLTTQELFAGLELIDCSTFLGLRDYALILFLYASGCRISEALAIKREDVVDGWLKIRFAKGEKERMVPLAPVAVEALNRYLGTLSYSSSFVWVNYRGEPLSRVSAYKIVKKYLGVSPHVLRHSFASSLIIGGADLRIVQELLGHSSLETTQIYTHIQKRHLATTMERYHPLKGRA
jgi:integrase/recombinase XerD